MRRHTPGAVALALATVLTPLSPAAATHSCSGTPASYVKVVQDLTGAEAGGQQIASGVMGNMYAYNRNLTCQAYGNGATNYAISALRLHLGTKVVNGNPWIEYVEGGLFYDGGHDTRPFLFLQWQYVPTGSTSPVVGSAVSASRVTVDQWYGFNISPHSVTTSGTTFKLQYVVGESQTGWTTLGTTAAISDGLGTPMVVGERTAHANGQIFARQLKYRPTSGWFAWTHMGCYLGDLGYGLGSVNDPAWDVVKFNETAFYTANQAPEPGGC